MIFSALLGFMGKTYFSRIFDKESGQYLGCFVHTDAIDLSESFFNSFGFNPETIHEWDDPGYKIELGIRDLLRDEQFVVHLKIRTNIVKPCPITEQICSLPKNSGPDILDFIKRVEKLIKKNTLLK